MPKDPSELTETETPSDTAMAAPATNRRGDVRLPDFIMLGQGKAGTSLVYRELKSRSDVGMSRRKELHYFNPSAESPEEEYIAEFKGISDKAQVVGEAAPDYLTISSIDRILATLGAQTKFIVSLRHPVDRAYSRYVQNIASGGEIGSFPITGEELAIRLNGLIEVLRHLYAQVPAEQILMLQYERDIVPKDPAYRSMIADFLGLDPTWPSGLMNDTRINPGVMPRYLWSGDEPIDITHGEAHYRLPRRTLAFCAQSRNSTFWRDPSRLQVCQALERQSRWTTVLDEPQYAELQRSAVRPAAAKIEAEFGFDMSHWSQAPKALMYRYAPPPSRFLRDPSAERDVVVNGLNPGPKAGAK